MKRQYFKRAGIRIDLKLVAISLPPNLEDSVKKLTENFIWLRGEGFGAKICPQCFKKHKTEKKLEECIQKYVENYVKQKAQKE